MQQHFVLSWFTNICAAEACEADMLLETASLCADFAVLLKYLCVIDHLGVPWA